MILNNCFKFRKIFNSDKYFFLYNIHHLDCANNRLFINKYEVILRNYVTKSSDEIQSYPSYFEPLIARSLYRSDNVRKIISLLIKNNVSNLR